MAANGIRPLRSEQRLMQNPTDPELRDLLRAVNRIAVVGIKSDPAEDAHRVPQEQDPTFVRLFQESNERIGPPAHVVVKKDSKVEIVAGKALITWNEGADVVDLTVGDDVWVKVRIDGREGWIHTAEDLNAIGLFASG
jgi:hypothetical protein